MRRMFCALTALVVVLTASIGSAADVAEHQWVRVSDQGTVQGRVVVPRNEGISAARGAKVSLIDQYGKYASSGVESDQTGRFTLSGVKPGVYTLLIQGEDTFACCAMHIVSNDVAMSDQFEIAAGAVKFEVVKSALVRYMQPSQVTPVVFDPSSNPMATDRAMTGESIRVTQFEGGLRGRLTRAGFTEDLGAKDANVLIFRDGVQVARTVTDSTGAFKVAQLGPGSYSVLGSGKDGFGLMGLELISPIALQSADVADQNETTFVAETDKVSDTFIMQVAPGPVTVIDDRLVDEQDLGPVVPTDGTATVGSSSMGGGGGGGGGAGGGGFGRLAVVGGIAALAIALGDDDDTINTPPVISPAVPVVTP